jgi:hypothetical protein
VPKWNEEYISDTAIRWNFLDVSDSPSSVAYSRDFSSLKSMVMWSVRQLATMRAIISSGRSFKPRGLHSRFAVNAPPFVVEIALLGFIMLRGGGLKVRAVVVRR